MEERVGIRDKSDSTGARMTSPQSVGTSFRWEGIRHHLVVERRQFTHTVQIQRFVWGSETEDALFKSNHGEGKKQVRSIRHFERKPSKGTTRRGREIQRSSSSPTKADPMASSSGNKPTMEERIAELEGSVQKLCNQLISLDDFLQNLDSEAGRHMEMLENDIIHTKSGLSEELWKLRKEMKDPKKEFEERVSSLEQQMEQMNKEWKLERDQSKKEGPK
jgi:exonuclease VII small subunit